MNEAVRKRVLNETNYIASSLLLIMNKALSDQKSFIRSKDHMKKIIILGLIFFGFSYTSTLLAQNCGEFNKSVEATYNFKPSKLNSDERSAKSVQMDLIWEKVEANQTELLPCLRIAINASGANNFFRFDASNLLIKFDRSDEAKKTLIKSYAAVDFEDIDLQYWMPYIALLGFQEFDTSSAGEKWLKASNSSYILPQHGDLQVNKEIGALIIYGSMDESVAAPALLKIASNENDPAREIAVNLLIKQATAESLQALKKLDQKKLSEHAKKELNDFLLKPKLLSARQGPPKITRQQYLDAFQSLVDGKSDAFIKLTIEVTDGEKDAVAVLKKEDIPLIRRARRAFAATANPHSAEWYQAFTDILLTMSLNEERPK